MWSFPIARVFKSCTDLFKSSLHLLICINLRKSTRNSLRWRKPQKIWVYPKKFSLLRVWLWSFQLSISVHFLGALRLRTLLWLLSFVPAGTVEMVKCCSPMSCSNVHPHLNNFPWKFSHLWLLSLSAPTTIGSLFIPIKIQRSSLFPCRIFKFWYFHNLAHFASFFLFFAKIFLAPCVVWIWSSRIISVGVIFLIVQ